jgi:hypothetical protein
LKHSTFSIAACSSEPSYKKAITFLREMAYAVVKTPTRKLVAEWLITKTSASRRAVMSREEGF